MDHTILYDEITNDPMNMGYAALGQDYQGIANLLNAHATVETPNPDPQLDVPRRISSDELRQTIEDASPGSTANLLTGAAYFPVWRDVLEPALLANDRETLTTWLAILGDKLPPPAVAQIMGLLAETEPDPTYQATIVTTEPSRADDLGLPTVTAAAVQYALNY